MTEDGGKAMKLRGTTMLYIKGGSPLDRLQPDEGDAARTHPPDPNIETGSAGTYESH